MKDLRDTKTLITDVDRRKALPIIRTLGEKGVKIIGIASHKMSLGSFSRYCAKVYICVDYKKNPIRFLEQFVDIVKIEQPDSLFPLEDEIIELLLQNIEMWNKYTKALLPSLENFTQAYDKWKTIQLAKEIGIRVPESYLPGTDEDINSIAANASFRLIIKPRKSSGSRGLVFLDCNSELLSQYKEVSKKYAAPIIQERIPEGGKGYGVFTLFDDNMQLRAVFGHKRLREYPISGGPSTLRMSYQDKALIEQSVALARRMKLVGVAMFEYKENCPNNEKVLMEINPRFWGSLQLAIFSGINFPLLYHQILTGNDPQNQFSFEEGNLCRWLLPGDILHFLMNKNRFRMEPSFFDFFNKKQTYDIESLRDPMPMFGIIWEGIRKLLHGNK